MPVIPAGEQESVTPPITLSLFEDRRVKPIIESEVTPNETFYKVQVDIFDPVIEAKDWRLNIKGSVDKPLTLSYDDILSMDSVEQYTTLECVSNNVGGDLIGNALWKGVPLKRILEEAGAKPSSRYVVFRCFDGYSVGIPLDKALTEGTILAYLMNGETLPSGHGFPLRAVVPGIYGMMNAKWIKEIEVVDYVYEGFWQKRGWSNDATIETTTVTQYPFAREHLVGKTPMAGIAFAGDRGVAKVEVSLDDGKTWSEATMKAPLSKYIWVLWRAEWNPKGVGDYRITVRATDKSGKVQTATIREPFPSGATGYHVIDVSVKPREG